MLKEVKILNYERSRIKYRWIFDSSFITHSNKCIVVLLTKYDLFNYYFDI